MKRALFTPNLICGRYSGERIKTIFFPSAQSGRSLCRGKWLSMAERADIDRRRERERVVGGVESMRYIVEIGDAEVDRTADALGCFDRLARKSIDQLVQ